MASFRIGKDLIIENEDRRFFTPLIRRRSTASFFSRNTLRREFPFAPSTALGVAFLDESGIKLGKGGSSDLAGEEHKPGVGDGQWTGGLVMPRGDSRDDYRRIRRQAEDRVWPDTDLSGGGVPAFLGQVTSDSSQIAVGKFFEVLPTFVLGEEVEGGVGQLIPSGSTNVLVYLVGPEVPSTGDYLPCRFVDHRWVAERAHVGGAVVPIGSIPGCSCTPIPVTLTMTSGDPNCNFQMFQSCSIQYGQTPDVYAPLNLGPTSFLSSESFPDPSLDGASFQYLLLCQYNQFTLTRVYSSCAFGSPYRDGILYTWEIGGSGNTCQPFRLDNGTAYPGSDATCFVQIDG